ncbi:MAG: type II toxin-antitoxin system VapC family toxin [bacterium]|nr:type II toxin-antitoxin system VapC family toxin [bacterium]
MNKPPVVIVDADAIIAQTNPEDIHHQRAGVISRNLIKMNARVIYPATAVVEAVTHMQRVLNSTVSAYKTAQLMSGADAQIAEISKQTITTALEYFGPTTSKKNTLFDCIVAAVAQKHKADAIFSFDRFYVKKGFKLAENLK